MWKMSYPLRMVWVRVIISCQKLWFHPTTPKLLLDNSFFYSDKVGMISHCMFNRHGFISPITITKKTFKINFIQDINTLFVILFHLVYSWFVPLATFLCLNYTSLPFIIWNYFSNLTPCFTFGQVFFLAITNVSVEVGWNQ